CRTPTLMVDLLRVFDPEERNPTFEGVNLAHQHSSPPVALCSKHLTPASRECRYRPLSVYECRGPAPDTGAWLPTRALQRRGWPTQMIVGLRARDWRSGRRQRLPTGCPRADV